MWKLPAASKQMVRARAAHIMATIDMPYPYRDLIANHQRYTISEWRWFLEYSPVILAPYLKNNQEVRRIVTARALCSPQAPQALELLMTTAAARELTCTFCYTL